jgi:prepilin-type N-terminal cleavage/methylation domain-containing protein
MKNLKAFTLIELIVATSILSITVFWIYKLIWENSKVVTNSNIITKTALLFPVVEACIDNLSPGFESGSIFIWTENDGYKYCLQENIPNEIDWIKYDFYAKKGVNEWEIKITSDFWTQTGSYTKTK